MFGIVFLLLNILLPIFLVSRLSVKVANRLKARLSALTRSLQWGAESVDPADLCQPCVPTSVTAQIVDVYVRKYVADPSTYPVGPLLAASKELNIRTRHALRMHSDQDNMAARIVLNALIEVATMSLNQARFHRYERALLRWWPLHGSTFVLDFTSPRMRISYPVLYEMRQWSAHDLPKVDYIWVYLQRKAIPFVVHPVFENVVRRVSFTQINALWHAAPLELFFNKSGAAYIAQTCAMFVACARSAQNDVCVIGPDEPPQIDKALYIMFPPALRIRTTASPWVFHQAARLALETSGSIDVRLHD